MHRVALLLACAYAASSSDIVYEPILPNPRLLWDRTARASQLQAYSVPLNIPDPNIHRLSVQQKVLPSLMPDKTLPLPVAQNLYEKYPYAEDSYAYYPYANHASLDSYPRNAHAQNVASLHDSPINLQSPPIPWSPPHYNDNLHDVEESVNRQKSHYTGNAIRDKDDKNFRYIILEKAIYDLAEEVATNGWSTYNSSYLNLVQKFIDSGLADPQKTVTLINCKWFVPVLEDIQKVKLIINHPVIRFVCTAQPSSCDAVIWAAIQLDQTPEVHESATALMIAAESAKTFLSYYAAAFETISTQNAYKYLFSAEDELRPLVASLAILRKYLTDRGQGKCLL